MFAKQVHRNKIHETTRYHLYTSGAIHKVQHEMSNLRYLVLHTGSARFMRGKRLGQGCRIDSTKIYTPYYHDRVTVFNEDRLTTCTINSSLLYSSTGVHKTEESVLGLILRKEANVRVTLCDYVVY